MKWFEILQKRVDKEDKYAFNFHNPLWFAMGLIAGANIVIGFKDVYRYVERLVLG